VTNIKFVDKMYSVLTFTLKQPLLLKQCYKLS